MAEIAVSGLTKRFAAVTAVDGIDLTIGDGEFLVLLGPTGAGKTTTLRLIAGLERPDAGRIMIGGHDVTRVEPAARDVTFVFQQYSLYPHLTVYENLAFPLKSPARRLPNDEIAKRVRKAGITLKSDRHDTEWKSRAFEVSDPSGFLLTIFSETSA